MFDEAEFAVLSKLYHEGGSGPLGPDGIISFSSGRSGEAEILIAEKLTPLEGAPSPINPFNPFESILQGERFKPLWEAYEHLTGVPGDYTYRFFHHRISLYGPLCKQCDKPLRSPRANFCCECGTIRSES
ncbi:MAG: hypothetical protein JO316_23705 [Abitibacteriaceae bacterium]|nr:hypothetical protein [Abditibacteriaceae bacterium]MBV9868371.1 hypothetical protein [Abditibacteriaceae bacterium]